MTRDEKLQMLAKLKALQQLKAQRQAQPQAQAQAQAEQEPYFMSEDDSRFDKFKHGLALSTIETVLGAKDIFTDLSENDKAVLKMMRRDAEKTGGWGTTGRIAGEAAQLALPAGALTKVAKARKLGKLATTGLDVGLAASHGALQAPEEGRSRSDRALESAFGAIAGAGAGAVLKKAMRGFTPTKAAEYLMKRGIKLTPGQAAKSGFPRAMEYIGNMFPGVAKSVERQRARAGQQLNKVALQEAAPPGVVVQSAGQDGLKELRKAFPKAYKEAWKNAGRPDDQALMDIMKTSYNWEQLGDAARLPMQRINDKIDVYLGKETAKNLNALDNQIRAEIKSAYRAGKVDLAEPLKAMRARLREGISKKGLKELEGLDAQYGKFKVTNDAANSMSALRPDDDLVAGYYDPIELLKASRNRGKKFGDTASVGEGPLQELAGAAAAAMARKEPNALVNAVRGVSKNVEIPIISDPVFQFGSDVVLGRTRPQKAMLWLADQLRQKGFNSANIGAAIED